MRWKKLETSQNVEDRRGRSSGFRGGKVGAGASIVLFLVVMVAGYYGIDLTPLLDGGGINMPSVTSPDNRQQYQPSAQEEEMARFSSVALKTTEDTWHTIFRQMGANYRPPKMVLYTGSTSTACGYGQSAMGPFYCPGDSTVYIDLSFYQDMKNKMGGGGDFAQGYVIAHEVGHHVQHLLGITQKVRDAQNGASQKEANRLSVMMELQADCFAGVWGRAMQQANIMEPGDLEEALRTAQAIGDDRLQKQSRGRVVPDSFTHGTSKQRYDWFKRGFNTGDPNECNTYSDSR